MYGVSGETSFLIRGSLVGFEAGWEYGKFNRDERYTTEITVPPKTTNDTLTATKEM